MCGDVVFSVVVIISFIVVVVVVYMFCSLVL